MLTLRDHDVDDYAALRDMDSTDVGVLDQADRACLDELGEYLVSSDTWRRFSIWLLHKHFEPDSGEVFAERVVTAPRGTRTAPVARCTAPDLSATSMRFDADVSAGLGITGMEFAAPADFGSSAAVSADDEPVLAGIAERLRAHGKTERFGVRLIRNPLGLSDDEVLLETCDIAQRTLHCRVGARGATANAVETTWQWRPGPGKFGPAVHRYCLNQCTMDAGNNHFITGHTNYPDS
ncbi:hypothetical protein [Mycobacterium terramassiliense]|uniref:Uncharacterized protein n=1 Tax=Mycobacterium terramassiliense TaxID=1841859 RepID=A0A2U3NAN3_9MYCO|nr:hypothetical protein [Mycobacterium terramassiliense]SPM28555.1 hypothetical protein MKSMC1_32290 [Mycobacterium terramassiliense]